MLTLVAICFAGCSGDEEEEDDENYSFDTYCNYNIVIEPKYATEYDIIIPIPIRNDIVPSIIINNITIVSGNCSFEVVQIDGKHGFRIKASSNIILVSNATTGWGRNEYPQLSMLKENNTIGPHSEEHVYDSVVKSIYSANSLEISIWYRTGDSDKYGGRYHFIDINDKIDPPNGNKEIQGKTGTVVSDNFSAFW